MVFNAPMKLKLWWFVSTKHKMPVWTLEPHLGILLKIKKGQENLKFDGDWVELWKKVWFFRQFRTKYVELSEVIKQNWIGIETFDICFCVLYNWYCQSLLLRLLLHPNLFFFSNCFWDYSSKRKFKTQICQSCVLLW